MIVTVTLNPCVDRLIYVKELLVNDTNRVLRIEEDAGGKGVNVARVLKRLKTPVVATGFLGGPAGRYVESVLSHEGVESAFVAIGGHTRTNFAVQERDGSPPTTLNESGPAIQARELEALRETVSKLSDKARFVCLGGSLPPGLDEGTYRSLADLATKKGAQVVLDADDSALAEGLKAKPFMIKPNEYEAERLLGRPIDSLEDAALAARELRDGGIPLVVVSMGAKGAAAAGPDGVYKSTAPSVNTVSTIGSGDSMIAGMLCVLFRGGPLSEALKWGTAAGSATAMTDGSDIGRLEDIEAIVAKVEVREA